MYINILFIIIMIAAIFIIVRHDALSKLVKGFVITMLLLSIGIALLFEYATQQNEKKSRPTYTAFMQGKTITCSGNEINNTIYSYEPGTSSFLPLLNVVGETFSIQECSKK